VNRSASNYVCSFKCFAVWNSAMWATLPVSRKSPSPPFPSQKPHM
jgi:hypothetical protein